MAIRYPLVLNGTTIEELQLADSIDFTSASISGDLTFTGTGARVKGNFSDPTATNRLLFQTSTANSTTLVGIMPNGTGSTSGIYGVNSSTLTNASYFDLRVSGSGNDVRLTSDYYGAGTYLPITFYTGGLEQVRITANSGAAANFQFSQSAMRITGDFSNGTAANRVLFQTSTANSPTAVGIMPSGTGSTSIIYGTNSSNLTNASYFDLRVSGSGNDVRLTSDYYGAGTYLPITFYTGGAERVRLDTSGNLSIVGLTASRALATDASKNLVSSTVTSTELGYLSGVTSAIQTQINSKAGTATANTFTNNQIISVSSASDALRITQAGAGNALVVEDSANPDSTPFVVAADGRVVAGYTSTITIPSGDGGLYGAGIEAIGASGGAASLGAVLYNNAAAGFAGAVSLAKSNSATVGTQALVASADLLGAIYFSGSDGTNFIRSAQIFANVDGTPGTNAMPGRLVFSTTADGASSPTERMRIDNAGRIGIGGSPTSSQRFVISGIQALGANTQYLLNQQTIASGATGQVLYYDTYLNMAASAFTTSQAIHFRSAQAPLSGGAAISSQYGFFADASLTGATNNYGFYSNIASGTGRYNFYAAGTADNYFGGPVTVSTSSASDALRITQAGSGNALVVEDSANPDATPFVIDSVGNIGQGLTSVTTTGFTGGYIAKSSTAFGPQLVYENATNDSSGPYYILQKGRAGAIVQSGDSLGNFQLRGFDGTNFIRGASIEAAVDGTPGTNDMPGRLVFSTTADGASTPTERMRIDNAGNVGIGGSPVTGASLSLLKNITGAATAYGVLNYPTILSGVTTAANLFQTLPTTQAAAFTLTTLRHYYANSQSFGAGSIVTNQYGFHAESTLTGATNNYGFYSSIASGAGRYNFYASGTADNYFAGAVGIGTVPSAVAGTSLLITSDGLGAATSRAIFINPTYASTVTGSARGVQVTFNTAAAAFTTASMSYFQVQQGTFGAGSAVTNQYGFEVASSLVGATNNYGFYSAIPAGANRYNFYAAGNADNYFAGATGIGTTPDSRLHVRQDQDGTTRTIIQNRNATGTPLSELTFISSTFSLSDNRYAYIQSGGGGSTYLSFGTCNASTPTERMQIAANGFVGIGTTPAAPFHVQTVATSTTAIIANTSGTDCFFVLRNSVTTSNNTRIGANSADLTLTTGGTERMRVDSAGNIYGTTGTTGMTNGFFYIPSAAGAPTNTPTAVAGRVPMYYDTTNNNFYVYNGAWKKVLLA